MFLKVKGNQQRRHRLFHAERKELSPMGRSDSEDKGKRLGGTRAGLNLVCWSKSMGSHLNFATNMIPLGNSLNQCIAKKWSANK